MSLSETTRVLARNIFNQLTTEGREAMRGEQDPRRQLTNDAERDLLLDLLKRLLGSTNHVEDFRHYNIVDQCTVAVTKTLLVQC